MISRGRLGALMALSMLGTVAATSAELRPAPADPEPDIDPHERKGRRSTPPKRVRYGSGPKLEHATEAEAHTDADRARIAAAIAKRERKAKR